MTQSMVADIRLDHLQEYEVQLILAVLERDAEIQRRDEARTRKLQWSIRGERLPKKRLSVKCRTGEWMNELSDQSKAPKAKGIEVVRASIKRKSLSKPKRGERVASKQEEYKENQEQGSTNERVEEPNALAKNYDVSKETSNYAENAEYKSSHKEGEKILREYDQPKRKTSFRRKKLQSDKQVKFAPEKTEKFVYETTKVEVENDKEAKEIPTAAVPTIIIDTSIDDTPRELSYEEDIASSAPKESAPESKYNEEPQKENSYESGKSFETYHSTVGKEIFTAEEQPVGDDAKPVNDADKPPTPTSKTTKKVKVVKRMGSSRKRGSPKITDDSSRNTVFNRMEYDKSADTNEAKYEDSKSKTEEEITTAYPNTTPTTYVDETSDTITKELDAIAKEEYKKVESDIQAEAKKPNLEKTEEYISSVLQSFGSESYEAAGAYDAATEITSSIFEEVKKEVGPESHDVKYSETKNDEEYTKEITEVVKTPSEDKSDVKKNIVDYLNSAVVGTEYPAVEEPVDTVADKASYEAEFVKTPDDHKDEYLPELPSQENKEPISEENKSCVEVAEVILDSPQKVGDEGGENESPSNKTKRKVVKKVIKKKAKPVAEEDDVPKPEEKAAEMEEEPIVNKSRLERKKTVRKKVVRKKPPQET